jgi:hypothetical protein
VGSSTHTKTGPRRRLCPLPGVVHAAACMGACGTYH